MVWNYYESRIDYHEMWGQPFGAAHAVPNFCRLAAWAMLAATRLLHVVIDHFFDDYFMVEPKVTVASATWACRRLFRLVGLNLDPDKAQLPAEVWHALGVAFDMQTLSSQGLLKVRAKPSRVLNAIVDIMQVLKENRLRPSHAAKIFGRLDFLNTTLFGRVGRTGLGPIKQRQHEVADQGPSLKGSWRLTPELRVALMWLINVISIAPPREMPIEEEGNSTCLLYTDGSSTDNRDPKHVVGAVLYDPIDGALLYTSAPVPQEVVDGWLAGPRVIHLVELFAGPLALDTWASRLRNRHVIHFVDNSAALGALVKGYSKVQNCIKLASDYWLRAAAHRIYVFIDRVKSKSNISDEPSRLEFSKLMVELGASWVEPNLSLLAERAPARDPTVWFNTPEQWEQTVRKLHDEVLAAPTTPGPSESVGAE